MAPYKVGFIGCGRPLRSEGATGFGMSHAHAIGYKTSPDCVITALADINLDNAKAFQETHGGERLYADYHEMLAKETLDIVSISTWPHLHAQMVIDTAAAGVKAIHCEKPMATTYGDSKRMVEACDQHGVQLTFNHQRRFGKPYRKARDLYSSVFSAEALDWAVQGDDPTLSDALLHAMWLLSALCRFVWNATTSSDGRGGTERVSWQILQS